MIKLNLTLMAIAITSALGTVAAQHQERKLFIELQQRQEEARQFEIEWGQLQLEQSTWAMHARIEQIARTRLQMQVPDASRIQMVVAPAPDTLGVAR